jgi:diguanylate cyclase (GGDEF)-like protein
MALRHAQLLTDMEDHGVVDGLTGCFNRTHGMKMLRAELKRAKRARTALSIAMFDLDYFKSVNDEYGHLCGDALLAAVGKKLQEMLRNSDIKCRYGGEEFLILLPDTPRQGAIQVGNMLRQELEKVSVEWAGQTVSITASIGIATADPGELESKALVGRADDALYRAKRAGRNRVCVDGADDSEASTETAPGEESLRRNSSSELPDASDRRQPVTTVAS